MIERIHKAIDSKAKIWAIALLWCLLISNLIVPRQWGFYGKGDWDLTYSTFEMARSSIVDYHQWPSYQPYAAFGSDMDANPQSVVVSIYFIPVLLLGTFYGLKFSVFLSMLIGFWGFFKWFNRLQSDQFINLCMSLITLSASYFSRHIWEAGHSNFMHAYWLPWCFYWFDVFKQSGKFNAWIKGSLILALPIAGGAPLIFIFIVLSLCLWSIGLWLNKTVKSKWLLYMCFAFVVALLLNAWKIIPAMDLWQTQPRLVTDDSSISPMVWLCAWLDYPIDSKTPHQWHEISIGFPLLLILLALYKIKAIKGFKTWLILSIVVVWINLGNFPSMVNPWYVLHHFVGIFDGIRAPYRIGLISLFAGAVLCVKTLPLYDDKKLIYIILIGFTLSQGLNYFSISNGMVFSPRIETIASVQSKYAVVKLKTEKDLMFPQIQQQNFVVNAYEPLHLTPVGDTLNTFISGASLESFSPKKIDYTATDSMVILNMRYQSQWQLKGQGKLTNHNGLLAIQQASGKGSLSYQNPLFSKGLIISLLTGLVVFAIWSLRFRNVLIQLTLEGVINAITSV